MTLPRMGQILNFVEIELKCGFFSATKLHKIINFIIFVMRV